MSGEISASDNETASAVNVNRPTFNAPEISGNYNQTTMNNTNNSTFVTHVGTDHVQQVPKFDEEAFKKYLKNLKIDYQDMRGNRHPTTQNMQRNIPAITKTSLEEGLKAMRGSERITDLHDLFPNISDKVIGLVGEAGSGKTTLLKLTQALFIDRGYFPFPIIVKNLRKGETKFTHFVKMYGYKDFPIDDLQGFSEWLNKNQKRIIFLIDGLDEASFDLSAHIQTVNVGVCASPHTWIAELISHEIMRESMVVFTTRPASVFKLPIEQRPDLLYALDGLDSGNMESVVNIYNKTNSSAIVAQINKHASKENNFLRSPFAVSMIAMLYDTSSKVSSLAEVTLTSLYRDALEERRLSVHNRRACNESLEENKKVQDRVDAFYLEKFFNNGKLTFTVAELTKCDLSPKQMDNHSFVHDHCKRSGHIIEEGDTMIEPSHLSVAEFHSARSILHESGKEFKEIVDKLFVLDDQDRKTLTRRFLAGLIGPDTDEEKQKIFLDKLAKTIKGYFADDLARKYKGDKYWQAVQLQGHLLNDLAELQDGMLELIREKFSTDSKLDMQIKLQDASMLDAVIKFMQTMQPQFEVLYLRLHDDHNNDDLSRFINAVVNLPTNVDEMQIWGIGNVDTSVWNKLVGKVDLKLVLNHNDEVEPSKIDQLKTALQCEMDLPQSRRMIVELRHRRGRVLLRHSSYTDISSPPILTSHLFARYKTLNLSKEIPASATDAINGQLFDFVISETHEIKRLSQIFATTPNIDINYLWVYLPYEVDMNLMREFCKNISKLENKVSQIQMYNIEEHVDFDEIQLLMEHCGYSLDLSFIGDINETAREQLERRLDSVHKSKTRDINVTIYFNTSFNNIEFLPFSQ